METGNDIDFLLIDFNWTHYRH